MESRNPLKSGRYFNLLDKILNKLFVMLVAIPLNRVGISIVKEVAEALNISQKESQSP